MNKENKVLAVDGDILAYRTAAVCEDHFEGACDTILDTTLEGIATNSGISKMRIYLSGADNFRYKVAMTKPYKGNRASFQRPKFLNHCKRYLRENYSAINCHGYEADDGVATDMVINGAIHCGIDKDLYQVPGLHFNYVWAAEGTRDPWVDVSAEQSIITLYRQILMGDASDNIPGLPRVGAKTAEKIITDFSTAPNDALEYYREVCADKFEMGFDADAYFEEQFNLIYIRRDVNLFDLITTNVAPTTDGFSEVEGVDDAFTSNGDFDLKL